MNSKKTFINYVVFTLNLEKNILFPKYRLQVISLKDEQHLKMNSTSDKIILKVIKWSA